VTLIKGLRGVSPLIYEALRKAKKITVMGVRSSKNIKFNNFWKKWHKERVRLKKEALMLFSDRKTEYWTFYKKLKYTKVREMISFTPSAITVLDENVFIFSYEKELVCIHIVSKSISRSFSEFFDGLWSVSTESSI